MELRQLEQSPQVHGNQEVLRCGRCRLVQFRPIKNGNSCRRCGGAFFQKQNSTFADFLPKETEARQLKINNAELLEKLPKRLVELRTVRKLSQTELHRKSTLGRSFISRLENGGATPGLSRLEKLGEVMHVSIDKFFRPASPEELLEDPFVAEVNSYLHVLTPDQWCDLFQILGKLCPKPL